MLERELEMEMEIVKFTDMILISWFVFQLLFKKLNRINAHEMAISNIAKIPKIIVFFIHI